ncbi:MAG: ribonuclease P protein component [Alphaproteobacteria bacterium]|nr:ribonuclease P protein component [Alphaproteobacteria bacterium]NNF25349.1 ribonuclease P protein component [Paracoccaceae bacterium]
MTPPDASKAAPKRGAAGIAPAVSSRLEVLKKRRDFLRASRARRQATGNFVLQARKRDPGEAPHDVIRIGYTCSKKVGGAVQRNRAKRRLRTAAGFVLPAHGRQGWDYVLIGRANATTDAPMTEIQTDLRRALRRIHEPGS